VSGRQAATARACLRLSRTTRETARRRPSERRFSVGCDRTRGAHAVVFGVVVFTPPDKRLNSS
jgi:hypothetical protein